MLIARVASVVAALAVCAWFGIAARQAANTSSATALVSSGRHLTPPDARRARALLSSAGNLNPDLGVELLRGQLALDQGRAATAQRIFESVTRREPLNLQAWVKLAYAAVATHDVRTGLAAGHHIVALYANPK